MCKVKFQSEDGTIFDTQEECKKYEETPAVYIVVRGFDFMEKVFLHYKDAKDYQKITAAQLRYPSSILRREILRRVETDVLKETLYVPIHKTLFQKIKEVVCGTN